MYAFRLAQERQYTSGERRATTEIGTAAVNLEIEAGCAALPSALLVLKTLHALMQGVSAPWVVHDAIHSTFYFVFELQR